MQLSINWRVVYSKKIKLIKNYIHLTNSHRKILAPCIYYVKYPTPFWQCNCTESSIMLEYFGEYRARNQRPFLMIFPPVSYILSSSTRFRFSYGFRSRDWDGHVTSLVRWSLKHFVWIRTDVLYNCPAGRFNHDPVVVSWQRQRDFIFKSGAVHDAMYPHKVLRAFGWRKQPHNIREAPP